MRCLRIEREHSDAPVRGILQGVLQHVVHRGYGLFILFAGLSESFTYKHEIRKFDSGEGRKFGRFEEVGQGMAVSEVPCIVDGIVDMPCPVQIGRYY